MSEEGSTLACSYVQFLKPFVFLISYFQHLQPPPQYGSLLCVCSLASLFNKYFVFMLF